ncbi:hypothetical protein HZC34_01165 [Candidatus Saganbacteria bacterium]|nr:hypothetical protein [Candidatus Saganbacteria bacterium]
MPFCRIALSFLILIAISAPKIFADEDLRRLPFDREYKTQEFSISFFPSYPLVVGESTKIAVRTALKAESISLSFDGKSVLDLKKEENAWRASFNVADKGEEGWRPLYIYIKYQKDIEKSFFDQLLELVRISNGKKYTTEFITKRIWYRAFKSQDRPASQRSSPRAERSLFKSASKEAFGLELSPQTEFISQEAPSLVIKGSRVFSFSQKSIEGTKEGFLPGINREESLRINVSGVIQSAEVNANFFSTSQIGATQTASREENVSILLKKGPLEAYFGDFSPNIDDLEFSNINKKLSGLQVKGENDRFGFKAIASSPKGQPKIKRMYGDNTQGPYNLGYSPLVVDSEQVYLDGIIQKRGNDYEVDYQAGTITFKYKTIKSISIIETSFDLRDTPYQHSTYVIRGKASPSGNLKLGATYINDSDLLNNAAVISQNVSQEPKSHYIFGVDGTYSAGDILTIGGEAAYSVKKQNILSSNSTDETGRAGKVTLSSQIGPISIASKYKKIGAQFLPASEASPKKNLTEYSNLLSFRPNELLFISSNADESRYLQENVNYRILNKGMRAKLSLKNLPSAEYTLSDILESNDPVTTQPIDRLTVRNFLELQHSLGLVKMSLKGGKEKRTITSPSEEATTYKTLNAAVSLLPQDYFQAASNFELKETSLPSGLRPITKTYIVNLSASPKREYLIASTLNYVDDAQAGISQSTDLSFKADPISQLKTTGKYTVSTLKETFGSTEEGIRKEEGSFNLEFRPLDKLRLRYYNKPNLKVLSRSQGVSYNNQTQQMEANIFIFSETMLGYSLQLNNGYNIDKNDYPNYSRKQNMLDGSTTIYSLKTAPLKFMSCEFNYILDNSKALTLTSTSEPASYSTSNAGNKEFDAIIKTSLSEVLAIDGSYIRKTLRSGSGEAIDNAISSLAQIGSLKLIYNLNNWLTISPSYAYSQTTNYLASANNEIYSIQPGCGIIIRIMDKLRIDGDFQYSKSYAGAAAEKTNFSVRGRYDMSDIVHITARLDTEIGRSPDYKTSEFSGIVEINL